MGAVPVFLFFSLFFLVVQAALILILSSVVSHRLNVAMETSDMYVCVNTGSRV